MQNLVRHKSGRYYARTFANNKEIWKSLRTKLRRSFGIELLLMPEGHRAASEHTTIRHALKT